MAATAAAIVRVLVCAYLVSASCLSLCELSEPTATPLSGYAGSGPLFDSGPRIQQPLPQEKHCSVRRKRDDDTGSTGTERGRRGEHRDAAHGGTARDTDGREPPRDANGCHKQQYGVENLGDQQRDGRADLCVSGNQNGKQDDIDSENAMGIRMSGVSRSRASSRTDVTIATAGTRANGARIRVGVTADAKPWPYTSVITGAAKSARKTDIGRSAAIVALSVACTISPSGARWFRSSGRGSGAPPPP